MKNIEQINPFQISVEQTAFGILTRLDADIEIAAKGSIPFGAKTLLTNYVYKENGTYNLIYTIIDADGAAESFIEYDGILPTLFLAPNAENYVSIQPYDPDRDYEISIPVFNREKTEQPKGNRPFVGGFIGISNQYSIFYDVDIWSETKPDKLLAIEFKNDVIKKKHNIKVPLPRNNNIFIENNEIHILAKDGAKWLHRQIDEKGNVIRERKLETNQKFFRQILNLSFDKKSHLLAQKKGKIILEKIDENGKSSTVELIDISDPFFNTWQPVKISENTFVTRFNGEFGNGWFTTKDDLLLEIFYSKGEKGYKNLLTNEVLKMDHDNLVISDLNKTHDQGYAIIFYPMTDRNTKNKTLLILNREVK
ncbi:hypothetical protein [Sphingobacterium spiritivorum]|uniref:hypothetical protein n=1 Tax=Sphingobacterium spiritivorum TaxID=258 RepID=UPI0019192956|nr:hypothetical protein [Sphingobacterium spiritivorum]QQT25617.1 hypothetical protein I6J02_18140 [Sphingobacterium spiritivorum]